MWRWGGGWVVFEGERERVSGGIGMLTGLMGAGFLCYEALVVVLLLLL